MIFDSHYLEDGHLIWNISLAIWEFLFYNMLAYSLDVSAMFVPSQSSYICKQLRVYVQHSFYRSTSCSTLILSFNENKDILYIMLHCMLEMLYLADKRIMLFNIFEYPK